MHGTGGTQKQNLVVKTEFEIENTLRAKRRIHEVNLDDSARKIER